MTQSAHRAAPRKRCVFCHGSPVTKEHVYPKWLRKTFGDSDSVRTFLRVAEGPLKRGKPSVPFDWTVRSVCRKCNGGWMSRLETSVQPLLTPMLHRSSVRLEADDVRVLVAWVFKTALMIHEQGRSDVHQLVPDRHYRHLFQYRQPPAQVRVWLGALDQPLDARVVATRASVERLEFTGIGDADTVVGTRFYGVSISLGPLMACLLGNVDNDYLPVLKGPLGDLLPEVWPTVVPISWPLPSNVEAHGGFEGVHRLLFEQPLTALPGYTSPWANPTYPSGGCTGKP